MQTNTFMAVAEDVNQTKVFKEECKAFQTGRPDAFVKKSPKM
jgi:hypothetical protein